MAGLFAVTVVGEDRPGIVAGVTRALYEGGCNLEDVTSTILRGHFSMVMIVHAPGDASEGSLGDLMRSAANELDIAVTVKEVSDAHGRQTLPTHMVSVYGVDRPGIVFRVADLLAKKGSNITDLTSRVLGPDDDPVYALMLEVVLDASVEDDLRSLGKELGVEVTVHPLDADVL
ncbi:MAG TPA: ACT domain-containing protein [Actinomycetota bacterium]|nr:ACT domain-containing protein [Actinomycetota bacterium]